MSANLFTILNNAYFFENANEQDRCTLQRVLRFCSGQHYATSSAQSAAARGGTKAARQVADGREQLGAARRHGQFRQRRLFSNAAADPTKASSQERGVAGP